MAIFPDIFPKVPHGGDIAASYNALNRAALEPLTKIAHAQSQLTYSNLMGPQFTAKLFSNPEILPNIPEPQRTRRLKALLESGDQEGGNIFNQSTPKERYGLLGWIANRLNISPTQQQPQQQPPYMPPLQQTIPTPLPTLQTKIPIAGTQGTEYQGQGPDRGYSYDKYGNNIVASPDETKAAGGSASSPTENSTWAKNVGVHRGIEDEEKEKGTIRAKNIEELNDIVFNSDTKLETLNDLNNMVSSPEIREIRQLPLLGRREMGWYAKEGTPAQQQLIGRFYAQMGDIVKNSSRDFAGQFRKGEQQLLQGMKPNDSDTVDVMIGKLESLTTMTKLLRERARLTSQYMDKFHINKLQASERADQEIDGNKIREQVHDKLNPTITVRNKKTGEVKNIPISEARKLGVTNV